MDEYYKFITVLVDTKVPQTEWTTRLADNFGVTRGRAHEIITQWAREVIDRDRK